MAKSKTKWPVIAGIVFIVGFIAVMAYSTLGNSGFRCEVCMTYNGQTVCKNGAGASQESAERVARDGACADLTHGMTELVQCQNSQAKVTWK
jgi:hypothetical protein